MLCIFAGIHQMLKEGLVFINTMTARLVRQYFDDGSRLRFNETLTPRGAVCV